MKSKSNPIRCFARNHMTIAEFAVWTFAREVSYKSGVFYASCTGMACQFKKAKKSNINNAVNGLLKNGWLVPLADKKRGPDGKWLPRPYRVRTHQEWAEEHPGCCSQQHYLAVPLCGMEDEETAEAVPPNGMDRSKTEGSAVPLFGRRFGSTSALESKNGTPPTFSNPKPTPKPSAIEKQIQFIEHWARIAKPEAVFLDSEKQDFVKVLPHLAALKNGKGLEPYAALAVMKRVAGFNADETAHAYRNIARTLVRDVKSAQATATEQELKTMQEYVTNYVKNIA